MLNLVAIGPAIKMLAAVYERHFIKKKKMNLIE